MQTRRRFLADAAGAATGALVGGTVRSFAAEGPEALGMISLEGPAEEVGRRFGRLNAAAIREHMAPILDGWRAEGLDQRRLAEKSKPFRRFLKKYAPAWEEEMAGCAEGAGVRLDDYVAFQAGKYRGLFALDECTSFFAVGDATADGATLFHKTRDNQARQQCAYRKALRH
ncbi:MAG: twin-arginine translocation signal domain-containing protein, partial [Phycisphaerae bacterium]|nr:twin-arginine translocation signal domain-containing protein [Phycisphaerae bacterium]